MQLPLLKWRIPEPPADNPKAEPAEIDLILVPAVALDLERRRCGHGAGFYDPYIERARGGTRPDGCGPCRAVGVGLIEQREEVVPIEEHDELLDGVIFPDAEAFAQDL